MSSKAQAEKCASREMEAENVINLKRDLLWYMIWGTHGWGL